MTDHQLSGSDLMARGASVSRRLVLRGALSGVAVAAVGTASWAVQGAHAQEATPSPAQSEEDLLRETEHRRLRSLVEFDMDVADTLHAEDFQLVNPFGGNLTKSEYLGGLEAGALDYLVFEPISPIEVRLYTDGAALRYQSTIDIAFSDGTGDAGTFWHTDVYEKREGQWQVVWSQATRIL